MSAAFVPNFTKTLVHSKKKAFELYAGILSILFVGLTLLCLAGIYFSAELVELYASAFHEIAGKFDLSVGLTRTMFPFFPLIAMAAVSMGALNSLGYYFLPGFAAAFFNIASIFAGLVICPLLEHFTAVPPIFGMAYGVVLGGLLQFTIQFWKLRRLGFVFSKVTHAFLSPFKVKGVKSVLWLLLPATFGLAATQLNILIISIYATEWGPGAVSWLNYAFRLMQFPIGVFGVSIAVATLPLVSRKLETEGEAAAAQEVNRSMRLTLAINGPAAAGLMAVGLPIIQLLFQHGQFTLSDSQSATQALFWYSLGLPGYAVVKILVPIFYAIRLTWVPVAISFVTVAGNWYLGHQFLHVYHYPFWSLAGAVSVMAIINALILIVVLAIRLPGSFNGKLLRSILMTAGFSAVVWFVAQKTVQVVALAEGYFSALPGGLLCFWGIQVMSACIVAVGVWIFLGRLFAVPEINQAFHFFQKKFRRKV